MSDVVTASAEAAASPPEGSVPRLDLPRRLELAAALDAVRAATTVCRQVQERSGAAASLKDDRSPVTIADFASQAVVLWSLQRALGPVPVVAEEDPACVSALGAGYLETVAAVARDVWPAATPAAVRDAIAAGLSMPDDRGFWTLDPLDGTRGFLRNQQYAIALAYIENGRPTLAVLGCPNLPSVGLEEAAGIGTGHVYFALAGHGAFEVAGGDPSAAPRRLTAGTRPADGTVRVCASVEPAHADSSGLARVMRHVAGSCRTVCLDSQAKYAVVARGGAEAYIRVPSSPDYAEWIWDHAAGSLIAAESGCGVTDLAGRPLDFGCGRRLHANRGVLCAGAGWQAPLLRAVQAALGDPGTGTGPR